MLRSSILYVGVLALAGCAVDSGSDGWGADDADDDVGDVAMLQHELLSGNGRVGSFYEIYLPLPAAGTLMQQWGSHDAPTLGMPAAGAVVRLERAAPVNGYYQVSHAGTWGWIHGDDLTYRHGPASSSLSTQRRAALDLGRSAMGYSYWWGNGYWDVQGATVWPLNNAGYCRGDCPNCTHGHAPTPNVSSPEYGADCSGFLSVIWGFAKNRPDSHGFTTAVYDKPRARGWSIRTIAGSLPGDAVVRYDPNRKAGHIVLVVTAPNAAGNFRTYECEGCKAGCRTRTRTIRDNNSDGWHGIRRVGTGWGG